MKKVYTAQNIILAGYLKDVVQEHGISCYVRNEHLSGGAGELPPIECWPEIWVLEEEDYSAAKRLIENVLKTDAKLDSPWYCKECGEHLEGQFTHCWQCGSSRVCSSVI